MKQAHRVYLKHKFQRTLPHQSPSFKSSVQRTIINNSHKQQQPGPGSYQLNLPMIKPKFQAIFKNNRSIIIKVNDIPVPAFSSKEERFKQYATMQVRDHDAYDLRQLQKSMPHKIKNSRRYNFAAPRKKNDENTSSTMILTTKNSIDYETLKTKGPQWSKYRQQRKVWRNSVNYPGPGAYDQRLKQPKHYVDSKNSWQFRSQTKRSFSQKQNNRSIHMPVQQIPQKQQKMKSIHSRHNLLDLQYQ